MINCVDLVGNNHAVNISQSKEILGCDYPHEAEDLEGVDCKQVCHMGEIDVGNCSWTRVGRQDQIQ